MEKSYTYTVGNIYDRKSNNYRNMNKALLAPDIL